MTYDAARSHASRRRDIISAVASASVNVTQGAASGLSPPAASSYDIHAFANSEDQLILENIGLGQDSSDDDD